MPSIKGKTVIVTGASAGVGEATAKLCVREGANVVLAARDGKALDALAAALGPRSRVVVTDVSKYADCEALMKAALESFGRIDGLVNNAGSTAAAPSRPLRSRTSSASSRST